MPEYRVTPAIVHRVTEDNLTEGSARITLEWMGPDGRRCWMDITDQVEVS
jgi:hypothetical protein